MASCKLTDGLVESATAGKTDAYLWDTALPRFGVRITPSGKRIYLIQYRSRSVSGEPAKTRRVTIGTHDGDLWNVTKARAAARKLLAPVDLGRDPFAEREAARGVEHAARLAAHAEAAAAAREIEKQVKETYEALTSRYIQQKAQANRSWEETERLLCFGKDNASALKRRSGHKTKPSEVGGPMSAWGTRHISEIRRPDVAALMESVSRRSPSVARATYAV